MLSLELKMGWIGECHTTRLAKHLKYLKHLKHLKHLNHVNDILIERNELLYFCFLSFIMQVTVEHDVLPNTKSATPFEILNQIVEDNLK